MYFKSNIDSEVCDADGDGGGGEVVDECRSKGGGEGGMIVFF